MESNILALVAALALLVHAGHTLHAVGAVRARSAASVAAGMLVGTASVLLLAYLLGHLLSWMYTDPDSGRITGPGVYFSAPSSFLSILPLGLLPLALCVAAAAERARTRAMVIVAAVLGVLVVPVLVAVGWSLFAQLDRPRGDGTYGSAVSLSGVARIWPAIVAHLIAAAGALTLARLIGARTGKYNRDGSANFIPAHALPTMIGGDVLLAIGIPMLAAAIAGDVAPRVANAWLAASAATLAAVVIDHRRHGRVDAGGPWMAALAGLVAGSLSGPAQPFLAIVCGVFAGAISIIWGLKLDLKLRIDEPSGLSLAHLVGGVLGAVGATLGAVLETGFHAGQLALLGSIGLSAAILVTVIAIAVTSLVALVLRRANLLRVDAVSESEGLDLSRHDVNAYPDFQQTLIKSYHLRQ